MDQELGRDNFGEGWIVLWLTLTIRMLALFLKELGLKYVSHQREGKSNVLWKRKKETESSA